MRLLVISLAFAAAPVAAAILWVRAQPDSLPVTSLEPTGIVWADRVFTEPAELRRWLRARGERYKVWAKHHPVQAATLEHRELPPTRKVAREPRAASGGGSSGVDGGILALIFGIAALSLLTFQLLRRVRVARPRVRLPSVAVDVAPLADGVRRSLGRLGRVPDAIRAGRIGTGVSRPRIELPRPFGSRGNGSTPRPVESRPAMRVARAEEPRVVSDAVVERVVPTVGPATALADLPVLEEPREVEEPRQVEERRVVEEPHEVVEPRRPAAPRNGNRVHVEREASPVDPTPQNGSHADVEREVPPVEATPQNGSHADVQHEVPLVERTPQNGSHVDVQQEVPPVEPPAVAGTTRADEIIEPPKPRNADALPKEGWERCAVSCWRGYVTAQFYVHPAGEAEAIATSSPFEWRAWQRAPRDPRAAQAALDELHGLLEIAGWEAVGRGDAWYELRFQREPPAAW